MGKPAMDWLPHMLQVCMGHSAYHCKPSTPLCQHCDLSFPTEDLALVYYLLSSSILSVWLLPLDA